MAVINFKLILLFIATIATNGFLSSEALSNDELLFSQFDCKGDFYSEDEIKVRKIGKGVEVEVTMSLGGGLILVDPQFNVYHDTLTFNIKSNALTGVVKGCKCKKRYIFRPYLVIKDRQIKTIYIALDGAVRSMVEIEY